MGQGVSSVQVEDRYFLQKVKLGQGNFSTVWRAADRQSGDLVAMKQLHKASLAEQSVASDDVEGEIAMMRACEHDNVIKLIDTFEDDNSFYLALEYCGDGDLGDKIQERGVTLSECEAADWIGQMCAAVQALHCKNICHRDIKPDNFMVTSRPSSEGVLSGNTCALKLSDFGLAVFVPRGRRLINKCGTPAFMPPEVHLLPYRSRGYGLPADMWAVGVSMHAVVCGGQYPFHDTSGRLDEALVLGGVLDFRGDGWKGFYGSSFRFSEEARKLCSSMIERDAGRRITAEAASLHPWLVQASLGGSESDPMPSRPSAGSDLDLDPVAWANIEDRSQPGAISAVAKAQAAAFPKVQASSQRQRNETFRSSIQEEVPHGALCEPFSTFPPPLETKLELEHEPEPVPVSSRTTDANTHSQRAGVRVESSDGDDSAALREELLFVRAEQESLLAQQRREMQRRFQRKFSRLQSQVNRLGQQFELTRPRETTGSVYFPASPTVASLSLLDENRFLRAELQQRKDKELRLTRQKLVWQHRLLRLRKRRRSAMRIPGEGMPRLLQRARRRILASKAWS